MRKQTTSAGIPLPKTVSPQHTATELGSSLMRAMHGFLLLTLKTPSASPPNASMKEPAYRKLSFIFPYSAKPIFLKTPRLFLPLDLCTCYSSCLELCSPDLHKHNSFIAFWLLHHHDSKFQYHYFPLWVRVHVILHPFTRGCKFYLFIVFCISH